VWVRPDYALEECPAPDIVCIPDFFIVPGDRCIGRFDAEIDWLRRCHAGGATMTSACTGAVMLAEAGLLDDADATIHWAYTRTLTRNFPRTRVHPERGLIVSGAGQRIVTAGGGTSWQDLVIYLIGRFVGAKQAMEVAKTYLTNWHEGGQQPFASLLLTQSAGDAVIAKCQEWLASHYTDRSPVSGMTRLSGLPERSFVRRFTRATGLSPLEYVHALRLEEAKQMLETDNLQVEAIANEVGYEDASFFSRLFRRKVGLTPAQYRRRFGQLRIALREPAAEDGKQVAAGPAATRI
jgi:transcriptional regulator GlxA family with amidase domain